MLALPPVLTLAARVAVLFCISFATLSRGHGQPLHDLPWPPRAVEDCGGDPCVEVSEAVRRRIATERLAISWNKLTAGIKAHKQDFTANESDALDALLMQIQGGLLSIGFVPLPGNQVQFTPRWALRLVPNTAALQHFLERKRREFPDIKDLEKLCRYARTLAQETQRAAPVVSVATSKRSAQK
jgi:hypothetical protein